MIVLRTTPVPSRYCRVCGHELHSATNFHGHAPSPGMVSLCVECGELSVFDNDLTLRAPTPEEARAMSLLPEVIALQLFIRGRKTSKPKQGEGGET